MSYPEQVAERAALVEAILKSDSPRKLIVAGPGTGKTYTFRQLFAGRPGYNQALTFIRGLAHDTASALEGLATSSTFHGFSRGLLHRIGAPGLTSHFRYYPPLIQLQGDDVRHLRGTAPQRGAIEAAFHSLEDPDGLIDAALRSGDLYDSVGFLDSVYRGYRRLEADPEVCPAFDQLVVDEYQDFSKLEVEFLRHLAMKSPVLVVGDDDQALYSFKHASANHIRALVDDRSYTRFELPHCSRCTEVLVSATHAIVRRAQSIGLLAGRIDKRYECYMPDKEIDSALYPKIIHAECSAQRSGVPYLGRYIERQLQVLPQADIDKSLERGEPSVLIIGTNPFLKDVYEYLSGAGWDIKYNAGSRLEVRISDGLRMLLEDDRSTLGWRILVYCDPPAGVSSVLQQCLAEGAALADVIPEKYASKWRRVMELARDAASGSELSATSVAELESAVGIGFEALLSEIGAGEGADDPPSVPPTAAIDDEPARPTIAAMPLILAKGLQAQHVFIVGMNDGHFPRQSPTDDDVCLLIVALTRAQKSCTLMSCRHYGAERLDQSVFVSWLKPAIKYIWVDREFLLTPSAGRLDAAS